MSCAQCGHCPAAGGRGSLLRFPPVGGGPSTPPRPGCAQGPAAPGFRVARASPLRERDSLCERRCAARMRGGRVGACACACACGRYDCVGWDGHKVLLPVAAPLTCHRCRLCPYRLPPTPVFLKPQPRCPFCSPGAQGAGLSSLFPGAVAFTPVLSSHLLGPTLGRTPCWALKELPGPGTWARAGPDAAGESLHFSEACSLIGQGG